MKLKNIWLVGKDIWYLTLPYFSTRDQGTIALPFLGHCRLPERFIALLLLVSIILLEFVRVGITVRLSYFNRDFFNAIQQYDKKAFWQLILTVFLFWVFIYIVSAILEYVLRAYLSIRWRRWFTQHIINAWLTKQTFYKMQLLKISPDNPDQRIANDIDAFVNTTLSLGLSFLSMFSTLFSFSIVLWTLSSKFPIPGTNIHFPGFLVWFCLLYTGGATYITHLIGRSLGYLNFQQQRYEADFRFSLARLREYNEPIALMQGYGFEKNQLSHRFLHVIHNFLRIVTITKRLISFRAGYSQLSVVIPYIVMTPYYFAKLIPLGVMSQTAGAFNTVIDAMSFFSSAYEQLAQYKSVIDRLMEFEKALEESAATKNETLPELSHTYEAGASSIILENVTIFRPNHKALLSIPHLEISRGESLLITGPSGSGKTTLFRMLMGVWPFTQGAIRVPDPNSMMSIPQKPYFPLGTLRSCLEYPHSLVDWTDKSLKDALSVVGLSFLEEHLDKEPPQHAWSLSLSGGEQQRLALARALLQNPAWIFLDESTSAVDEAMELELYTLLKSQLPESTLISISHRSSLKALHKRILTITPFFHEIPGCFQLLDAHT